LGNIIIRAVLAGASCALAFAPRVLSADANAWTPLGPDGGIVHDVEFSQTSPGTFYAVGVSGVYRSTVAGDSFELLREDFGFQNAWDLAVDPAQSDRVLVAADGFYIRSGANWTVTRWQGQGTGAKVEISRDGATAYFAVGTRIFRSLDRGATWQERAPIPGAQPLQLVNALQSDPGDADVVYASVFGRGIFGSTDGANSWQPLGAVPAIARTMSFVVDPSNPLRLLAATESGLHVSDDRGANWSATAWTAWTSDVDVDPFDSRVIYVAGEDFRRSTDGGVTWTRLDVDQPSGYLKLAIDPAEPSRLAAFGGEGVSVSTDAGATWAKRIAGFKGTMPTAFSVSATSRRNYFGVAGRGGVYYVEAGESVARSVNNDPLIVLAGEPQGLVSIQVQAVPGAADTLYAVLRNRILARSVDAGLHWTELPSPGTSISYVAASPLEPLTLYAGAAPGNIFKSIDGGAHWTASGAGLPSDLYVDMIAIAATPATLYAVGFDAGQFGVYRSDDAGATWVAASPLQTRPILSITIDPNDARVVYGGFDGDLRKTTDGGATWTTLTRNGNPLCCSFGGVVFDPSNRNVLYAQHSAAWRTVDGGASWELVPPARNAVSAARGTLALDPTNPSRLLAGWSGLGVRELTIAPDLALTLGAPGSLTQDVRADYTLTLSNLGPFDATDVRVAVQLPSTAIAPSVTAAGSACPLSGATATCSFDVVRSAGSAAAIAVSFVPAAGSATLAASVTGGQPDPASANNTVGSTLTAAAPTPAPSGGGGGGGGATTLDALALLLAALLLRRREPCRTTPPGARRRARPARRPRAVAARTRA
jgi:photosystem II stability/assembly factor-like uncharacterized protein